MPKSIFLFQSEEISTRCPKYDEISKNEKRPRKKNLLVIHESGKMHECQWRTHSAMRCVQTTCSWRAAGNSLQKRGEKNAKNLTGSYSWADDRVESSGQCGCDSPPLVASFSVFLLVGQWRLSYISAWIADWSEIQSENQPIKLKKPVGESFWSLTSNNGAGLCHFPLKNVTDFPFAGEAIFVSTCEDELLKTTTS